MHISTICKKTNLKKGNMRKMPLKSKVVNSLSCILMEASTIIAITTLTTHNIKIP
jgi:hypothetical protein